MIRRRGENISAYEVEEVVNNFRGVLESAAVGVPENTGIAGDEDVKVVVVLQEGVKSISPVELLDFCAERMAYFMVPRYIEFKESLPKNAIEKIEKYKLVAEGVSANTWDREKAGYKLKR
jgi:crotonobetaine/carnitine-CoA ligase